MKINCLRKDKEKIIFEDVDNLMLLYCVYDVVFIFPFYFAGNLALCSALTKLSGDEWRKAKIKLNSVIVTEVS